MFEIYSQRFAFWTDEARILLQGTLKPVYTVPRRGAVTDEVPLHMQAVTERTAKETRLVDFIIQSKGAEQHLVDVLSGKRSTWIHQKSCCQMPVYLDSEEQQDKLFAFLKTTAQRTTTPLSFTDEVLFIFDVLSPEAIIYGLSMQDNLSLQDSLSLQEAEQVFFQLTIKVKWRSFVKGLKKT
ncbi:PWWP domain-containing DNA repair factor 3B-like [Amphiprion ocellaris]|uniref:PWWP domain-containing DNA repair factor 3B-like n=1 Tax=Amphiprion ocellaris TaxID=80972 RepID=UPI00241161F2|nr:PWWP domain-containing DNA repair factor 3B-like [Amphiprion ocellaris]XP_054865554.1 PWWP domain-containing DNA repair factor 3B-like [Amphiprion ocellaris]